MKLSLPFSRSTAEQKIAAECEQLRAAVDTLVKERDELQAHLRRLNEQLARTTFPPGHFYSPVVDPQDEHVRKILQELETLELDPAAGLALDDSLMLESLGWIADYYPDLPFSAERTPGLRYFYDNPAFSYGDAIVYFGMLRHFKPRRIVEAGAGYSSCLAMDTNDLFFGGKIEITNIDPYPETLTGLLEQGDRYLASVRAMKLQDVPADMFQSLGVGDILFLDSSHVAKMGSEVNDYLFRILPALSSGIVIHIHDIAYPFEYGPAETGAAIPHSWNEAYLLRAFLQYNHAFQVIYFNHYMYRHFEEELRARVPKCLINPGGGIWLRKL